MTQLQTDPAIKHLLPVCPHCGHTEYIKKEHTGNFGKIRRLRCKKCRKRYYTDAYKVDVPTHKLPRILVLDIETAPLRALVWGMWKQVVTPAQIESDWFMLTWSAKWLYDDRVYSDKLTPYEAVNEDDSRITQSIWYLVNNADIVIAHNGRKFDMRRLNTRFLMHRIPPPLPYQMIDTLEKIKQVCDMSTYKLDEINKALGIGRKLETNIDLWRGCIMGDRNSLERMEIYNREDVVILEDHYLITRPYMKSHPNLGLYTEFQGSECPTCNGKDLTFAGYYYSNVNKFRAVRCNGCGAVGRLRVSEKKDKKKSKNLVVSVAR